MDPGTALALGEAETGGLFFAVFSSVMAARRAALKWPRLARWAPPWSRLALVEAEVAFLMWALLFAGHALGPFVKVPDAGPLGFLFLGVDVPAVGSIFLSNVLEAMALTAACLYAGQGTLRVALYVLPVWYGFHDGLYFLAFDLWGGYLPFVYNAMLAPYPASYFPSFLVDIWQAMSVALVALAAWLSRSPAARLALLGLVAAWAVAALLPLGTTTAPEYPGGPVVPVPVGFTLLYAAGGLPYMLAYTAALYLILWPRRAA